MENEFVTYEQSVKLKGLGFNEPCFRYVYIDNNKQTNEVKPRFSDNFNSSKLIVSIPLKQQVFRWFREVHNSISHIEMSGDKFFWCLLWNEDLKKFTAINRYVTYEEAENKCINQLISLIEDKN